MKGTAPRLGEIGLANYPPYLMNRIMGRYNAAIRAEMAKLGLTTPKMRALAVLSVMDGLVIGQLAVHALVEPVDFAADVRQRRIGSQRRHVSPACRAPAAESAPSIEPWPAERKGEGGDSSCPPLFRTLAKAFYNQNKTT
jgi:hypothetical protein